MKTNYEKLYLIQPQIYHKMLPLLNEIDKRNVKEINEEHNADTHDSEETEINQEIIDSSDVQNHSDNTDHLPAIYKVSPQATPPKEDLSFDVSAINSLSGSEMSKHEVPAKITSPMIPSKEDDIDLQKSQFSQENLQNSAFKKMKPKRYICEICTNRGFTSKFSLRRHNNQFHSSNRNIKKATTTEPDILSTSESKPETITRNQKRQRDESVEKDEIPYIQESKKLKTRGLKRWAESEQAPYEQHLPRKSARIQSYKERPPILAPIQRGQGLLNWVNF